MRYIPYSSVILLTIVGACAKPADKPVAGASGGVGGVGRVGGIPDFHNPADPAFNQ